MNRIEDRINKLEEIKQTGLVSYIMGGVPNLSMFNKILKVLANSGTDILEIGIPFSDPVADGPVIQRSAEQAILNQVNIDLILSQIKIFRKTNKNTPIILMGYFNNIFHYGLDKFLDNCSEYGVDGAIIVDLPIEENLSLISSFKKLDIQLINLITPNTDLARLQLISDNNFASFLYYVSVLGTTGSKTPQHIIVSKKVNSIKKQINKKIAIGFGIKKPDQVDNLKSVSDLIVIGTQYCKIIQENKNPLAKLEEFNKNIRNSLVS
jgi:tryptophan synthase alpha chain